MGPVRGLPLPRDKDDEHHEDGEVDSGGYGDERVDADVHVVVRSSRAEPARRSEIAIKAIESNPKSALTGTFMKPSGMWSFAKIISKD